MSIDKKLERAGEFVDMARDGQPYEEQAQYYERAWELTDDAARLLIEQVEMMCSFAHDTHVNWDCDKEAHNYGTPCRSCEAGKVLRKIKELTSQEGDK